MFPGRAQRLERELGGRGADGRSDPGDMEPGDPFEGRLPVDRTRFRDRDGAPRTIVENFGGSLIRACFHEVEAHAAWAIHNVVYVDPKSAQFACQAVRQGV